MTLNIKPTHKVVKDYFQEQKNYSSMGFVAEGAVAPAFAALLRACAKQFGWSLVEQYTMVRKGSYIRVDGALVDGYKLAHGFWEAKDTADDLDIEIKKKLDNGYPIDNILFQAPDRAVLVQDGQRVFDGSISEPEGLLEALKSFFSYRPPAFERWDQAVEAFKERVPELGRSLSQLVRKERGENKTFIAAFDAFMRLCKESINPNIAPEAVEEMLIQHLLTERIFRTVFQNPDFTKRNVIAHEIEKVVEALTSRSFSRSEFLTFLDPFYKAIEETAATITSYSEKQDFLNTVYERFFQGYSVKVADTHGIVYTPQPIVDFMVRSVEEILKKEFGRSLSDSGVHILDPFVGTGNFILRVMREIDPTKLEQKYKEELHCNEVMLLPYYIASMNIEHEFYERTGYYEPFEGICLVDTFELAEGKQKQLKLFDEENAARVERQKKAPIFVILGNPPYNAGQVNENDNNKNRKYKVIDKRVKNSYGDQSNATLRRKLNDPYVKAIRYATDRIVDEGVVCFVTNKSFIDEYSFDGMRKDIEKEFSKVYLLDLGGNVHKNQKLTGTKHNVFGIKVGVSVNLFIKKRGHVTKGIYYSSLDEYWTKNEKYSYLNNKKAISNIGWKKLKMGSSGDWFQSGHADFDSFDSLVSKDGKSICKTSSLGLSTNRDRFVYSFLKTSLKEQIEFFIEKYNYEVFKYHRSNKTQSVDRFVDYEHVAWSETLKKHLEQGETVTIDESKVKKCNYRPFTKLYVYYDNILIDRPSKFFENSHLNICFTGIASEKPFIVLACIGLVDLHYTSPGCTTVTVPFYIEDGTINISSECYKKCKDKYGDDKIKEDDILYLWPAPPSRIPRKICRKPEARTASHSFCPGLLGLFQGRQGPGRLAHQLRVHARISSHAYHH